MCPMVLRVSYVESSSGLLVPSEPMSRCNICGEEFPVAADAALVAHVERCYRRHEDELGAEAEEVAAPMWEHDEERYRWLRERGGS